MFALIDPGWTENYQQSPEHHVVVVRLLLSGCCCHNHKIRWMHDGHTFHTYARHILRYISSLKLDTIKCPPSRTKWASDKGPVIIATLHLRIVQGVHLLPFLGMPLWNSAPTNSSKASHVGSCGISHPPLLTNGLSVMYQPHFVPPDDFKRQAHLGWGAVSYSSLSITQVKIYSSSYLIKHWSPCLIFTLIWQESRNLL